MRIGPGLAARLDQEVAALAAGGRPVIITDSIVHQAWPSLLPGIARLVFPAGEASKTRDSWASLTDQLLGSGVDRHTLIIALGGGVTGDLAGFVAATTLRGLRWIAVPTTTLAMLDASVGGKTGIDTPHGKNLIGAFHPPVAVVADPALLTTLATTTYREGLAEAVKHAAIADAEQWRWLEDNAAAILERDVDVVAELVRRSVAIKARVVETDEHEQGERASLNAGHTVAHAIEQATDFAVPHGHAVAIGLITETRLAEQLGVAASGTADRITTLLARFGLPTTPPRALDPARLTAALQLDKKNRDGTIRAALLADIGRIARSGEGGWTHEIDGGEVITLLTS